MLKVLDYFLYGTEATTEVKIVVENLLKSEKYFQLLEVLIKNYAEGNKNPAKKITTDARVYNPVNSYKLWVKYYSKGRSVDQHMTGLDSKTVETFKLKYVRNLLTQFRWGQSIPMIDWPGAQIHHIGGADFGTDFGTCEGIAPFVHLDKPWDYSEPITGSFPGDANGLTMMLDAEVFDTGISKATGTGFKIALFYFMDVPVMATGGIGINVGTYTQLGVAAKAIETSLEAKATFRPERRGLGVVIVTPKLKIHHVEQFISLFGHIITFY